MSDRELTVKQQIFVAAYLETFNGTEAARAARYRGDDNTLSSVGYENLRKPEIRQVIEKKLETYVMSATEALSHLANIARDYESPSQLRALELICKHLGLFTDKLDITSRGDGLGETLDKLISKTYGSKAG